MARGESNIASSRRASKPTREMLARRNEARLGYAMVSDGFECITCDHHEDAPRDSRWDASREEEDARIEQVHAAAARIQTHVATHRLTS